MALTKEFIEAVNEKDLIMVKIMLKDGIIVDPTMKLYNEMIEYAESSIFDLYDKHDGEQLEYNEQLWNKGYMDMQMLKVVNNFSKERVNLLVSICKHLYKDRADKINQDRSINQSKPVITQKQVGIGITVAGVGLVIAGAALSKAVVAGVGVAGIVAGGIAIATSK